MCYHLYKKHPLQETKTLILFVVDNATQITQWKIKLPKIKQISVSIIYENFGIHQ